MASNWFMDTMSGIGNAMGDMASGVGNMFGWGGGSAPMGSTMPKPITPTPQMAPMGNAASYGMTQEQFNTSLGAVPMPTVNASPVTSAGIDPTTGKATSDIANAAGDIERFKQGLTKTNALGFGPEGTTVIGDYALTQDQLSQYDQLTQAYGALPGQRMGVKAEGAPSWFAAKGVPMAKMALAGGSLYLGSKSADMFKKQMEASQQVAQKNLENQTALINTYMYDRQAARYSADPSSQQTPEEYMAEHGL